MIKQLGTEMMSTLGQAIITKYRGDSSPAITLPSSMSPMEELISIIHYFPISWRKWNLDLARIQEDFTVNMHLSNALNNLQPVSIITSSRRSSRIITREYMASLSRNFYDSPISLSLLSYLVRAEVPHDREEFLLEKEKSWKKEVQAALETSSLTQRLNYASFFTSTLAPVVWTPNGVQDGREVARLLKATIRSIKQEFSRHLDTLLFPYYNENKNIGYTTQERLALSMNGAPNLHAGYSLTSADLLKYYADTGNRIGGPMEVRQAWFFNDLKPRTYYCLGGDGYWAGLYIKPIANRLIKALPSSNPYSRFDVTRQGNVGSDEILVTYDFTSFTTSLDQLKYFLHHLALEFVGTSVSIFDVREGVLEIDLGSYLDHYNKIVNEFQEVDLRRIHGEVREALINQGRNGSLGCQGNIVFSTLLHAVLLGTLTGTPSRDSCVGDDALAKILTSFFEAFISAITTLGEIHVDKFTTFSRPPDTDPTLANRQQFKYLKRPITVDFIGVIRTGTLDFFPSIADALLQGDGIHSSSFGKSYYDSIRTFCTQWGRFLYLHHDTHYTDQATDAELDLILSAVQLVYEKYGISQLGDLPGFYLVDPKTKVKSVPCDFFVPPCHHSSVYYEDWVDSLLQYHYGRSFVEPVRVGGEILPPIHLVEQDRFRATSGHPYTKILKLLGYIDWTVETTEVIFNEEYAGVLKRKLVGDYESEEILVSCVVNRVPSYHFEVMQKLSPLLSNTDPDSKQDEIYSIFSGFSII